METSGAASNRKKLQDIQRKPVTQPFKQSQRKSSLQEQILQTLRVRGAPNPADYNRMQRPSGQQQLYQTAHLMGHKRQFSRSSHQHKRIQTKDGSFDGQSNNQPIINLALPPAPPETDRMLQHSLINKEHNQQRQAAILKSDQRPTERSVTGGLEYAEPEGDGSKIDKHELQTVTNQGHARAIGASPWSGQSQEMYALASFLKNESPSLTNIADPITPIMFGGQRLGAGLTGQDSPDLAHTAKSRRQEALNLDLEGAMSEELTHSPDRGSLDGNKDKKLSKKRLPVFQKQASDDRVSQTSQEYENFQKYAASRCKQNAHQSPESFKKLRKLGFTDPDLQKLEQAIFRGHQPSDLFEKMDTHGQKLDDSEQQTQFMEALADALMLLGEIRTKQQLKKEEKRSQRELEKKILELGPLQKPQDTHSPDTKLNPSFKLNFGVSQPSQETLLLHEDKNSAQSMGSAAKFRDHAPIQEFKTMQTSQMRQLNDDLSPVRRFDKKDLAAKRFSSGKITAEKGQSRNRLHLHDSVVQSTASQFKLAPEAIQNKERIADLDILKRQMRHGNYIDAMKSYGSIASQTEKDFQMMKDLFSSGHFDSKFQTQAGFDKEKGTPELLLVDQDAPKRQHIQINHNRNPTSLQSLDTTQNLMLSSRLANKAAHSHKQSIDTATIKQNCDKDGDEKLKSMDKKSLKKITGANGDGKSRQKLRIMSPILNMPSSDHNRFCVTQTRIRAPNASKRPQTHASYNTVSGMLESKDNGTKSQHQLGLTGYQKKTFSHKERLQSIQQRRNQSKTTQKVTTHSKLLSSTDRGKHELHRTVKSLLARKDQATQSVREENEENSDFELESAKARQDLKQEVKAIFPYKIYERNVQVMVPKTKEAATGSLKQMGSSPFLLGLNQKKLTPFETIRAHQKTRKLMIQHGIHQTASMSHQNLGKELKPIQAQMWERKSSNNPHMIKMRLKYGPASKKASSLRSKENTIVVQQPNLALPQSPPANLKTETEAWESIPMLANTSHRASAEDLQQFAKQVQILRRQRSLGDLSQSNISRAQAHSPTFVTHLKTDNTSSAQGESVSNLEAKFIKNNHLNTHRAQQAISYANTQQKKSSTSTLRPSVGQISQENNVSDKKRRSTRAHSSNRKSNQKKDQSVKQKGRTPNSHEVLGQTQAPSNGMVHKVGINSQEEINVPLPLDKVQSWNSKQADNGPQTRELYDQMEAARRETSIGVEQMDLSYDENVNFNMQISTFQKKSLYKNYENSKHVTSSQFLRKWNVEYTDKVIEVEEEASIINPNQKVRTFGNVKVNAVGNNSPKNSSLDSINAPAEGRNKPAAESITNQNAQKTVQLSKNTLIVPNQKVQSKQRVPFSNTRRLLHPLKTLSKFNVKGEKAGQKSLLADSLGIMAAGKTFDSVYLQTIGVSGQMKSDGLYKIERRTPKRLQESSAVSKQSKLSQGNSTIYQPMTELRSKEESAQNVHRRRIFISKKDSRYKLEQFKNRARPASDLSLPAPIIHDVKVLTPDKRAGTQVGNYVHTESEFTKNVKAKGARQVAFDIAIEKKPTHSFGLGTLSFQTPVGDDQSRNLNNRSSNLKGILAQNNYLSLESSESKVDLQNQMVEKSNMKGGSSRNLINPDLALLGSRISLAPTLKPYQTQYVHVKDKQIPSKESQSLSVSESERIELGAEKLKQDKELSFFSNPDNSDLGCESQDHQDQAENTAEDIIVRTQSLQSPASHDEKRSTLENKEERSVSVTSLLKEN